MSAQRFFVVMIGLLFVVVAFQNCGKGFQATNPVAGDGTSASTLPPGQTSPPVVDPLGPLSVFVQNAEIDQGGLLSFKVELNKAHTDPVIITLGTVNGTATAISDYLPYQSSVTIPVGQTSLNITVQTILTSLAINDKQLKLVASQTSAGQIKQAEGTGLIKAMKVKAISGGGQHVCVITAQDTVKCWGVNSAGQLGNNTIVESKLPVDVGLVGVKKIMAGYQHTCVVTAQDTVKCWGYNFYGQLGNNTTVNSPVPVDVIGLTGIKDLTQGGGNYFTCAITLLNTVKCWGDGYGLIPVDIVGATDVKEMISAELHSCILTNAGGVKCWGGARSNQNGQLGNNSTVDSMTLVDVTGLTAGVKSIAAGNLHTCAITAQDTVKCWGSDATGQLGNNSLIDSPVPVDALGLTGIKNISAYNLRSCATTALNTVKCWGSGGLPLSNINFPTAATNALTPVDAMGIADIKSVKIGASYSCGITNLDTIKCWGYARTDTQ